MHPLSGYYNYKASHKKTFDVEFFFQALEEEETMTPEQLAIKNVGKQVGNTEAILGFRYTNLVNGKCTRFLDTSNLRECVLSAPAFGY